MTRPYFLSDALENTHPQLSRFGDELMTRFPRRLGRLHHIRHRPGPERFIHLLDQYVGSQEDNRYTLGTQFLATVRISADNAGDVQSLSHELHSSRLDYLGIEAAIRGFCHEFSKQHDVSIEFTDGDVPAELPRDVSLCLFHVAQEALHNAVKYSG
jgi:hypothetical protein